MMNALRCQLDKSGYGNIGLGCLQLDQLPEEAGIDLIVKAYDLGVRVFDTAAAYGTCRSNEKLLGKAIKKLKEKYGDDAKIFIATKCGIHFFKNGQLAPDYEIKPAEIQQSVEKSLKHLGIDCIPLVYLHRMNPSATKEENIAALSTLKQLAEQGKVQWIGLSETTGAQIQLANQVFKNTRLSYNPLAFFQCAYSPGTCRADFNGVRKTCDELGIQLVSYTSVMRGLVDKELSKQISMEDLEELNADQLIQKVKHILNMDDQDYRLLVGFFHSSCIAQNMRCILEFQNLAEKWKMEPSQLALAWQKASGAIAIPATTKEKHLKSNIEAMQHTLTGEQVAQINACFKNFTGNPNMPNMLDDNSLEVSDS